MAKGRYIKAAERACSAKARFETALEAERTCEWRYRAYQCPVCHGFHLTSTPGNALTAEQPLPSKKTEPGPKLADLDWSAALAPEPKAKPPRPVKPKKPVRPPEPPPRFAKCAAAPGKDGKVALVQEGRLIKSAPIRDKAIRMRLKEGVEVRISYDDPPSVLGLSV